MNSYANGFLASVAEGLAYLYLPRFSQCAKYYKEPEIGPDLKKYDLISFWNQHGDR